MTTRNELVADLVDCEAYKYLEAQTRGVTFSQLYTQCVEYGSEIDLSRELNKLITFKLVQRRGTEYWAIAKIPPVSHKISPKLDSLPEDPIAVQQELPQPTAPTKVDKLDSEEPLEKTTSKPLLSGNLRRTGPITKIALTFYFRKQESFTVAQILELTRTNYANGWRIIKNLVKDNYVLKLSNGEYKWSETYKYPFSSTKKEDIAWSTLEKNPIKQDCPDPDAQSLPLALQSSSNINSTNLTLLGLDAVISRYKLELQSLEQLRELLLNNE